MDAFASTLNIESKQFAANVKHHRALADELRIRLDKARAGGGSAARKRHEARGKLFVRERIERLLDPGAPFLELSPLAAHELYDKSRRVRKHVSHASESGGISDRICRQVRLRGDRDQGSTEQTEPLGYAEEHRQGVRLLLR